MRISRCADTGPHGNVHLRISYFSKGYVALEVYTRQRLECEAFEAWDHPIGFCPDVGTLEGRSDHKTRSPADSPCWLPSDFTEETASSQELIIIEMENACAKIRRTASQFLAKHEL